MAKVTGSVDIAVPVQTAYDQWTQFEEFPSIMTGVENVEQLDDTHLRWKQNVAGREKEWIAEIVEQVPDNRIAWRTTSGENASGQVTFTELSPNETRVELAMEYEPDGMVEKGGSMFGMDTMRVQQDLNKFKEYIEERGQATGGWRGTVSRDA